MTWMGPGPFSNKVSVQSAIRMRAVSFLLEIRGRKHKTSERASVTASTIHVTLDSKLYDRSLVLRLSLRFASQNFGQKRDCSQSDHLPSTRWKQQTNKQIYKQEN